MRKASKNFVIFSLALFLCLILANGFVFAQKQLEVDYPEIQGSKPETTAVPIPEYVKYIFNFAIAICGLIGFGVLIFGGVRYLTSAGNSEKLKEAKKQVKSALLGILILLFSYLILITINPQLTIFQFKIEPTPPSPPLLSEPSISISKADLLGRIRKLAEETKEPLEPIKKTAEKIKSLTGNCNCNTTRPLCLCKNYYGACSPDDVNPCYSAQTTQPCPDDKEIKENQLIIFAQRDDMLYYKNRALAEKQDLIDDIEKIIKKKIKWYEDKIAAEKQVLNQLEEGAQKNIQQEIINSLEAEKAKLEKEKVYKENLAGKQGSKGKLQELADAIEGLRNPATKISELPNECLANVPKKCKGICQGGCHDTLGCFPGNCSGGNPCPTQDIQNQATTINSKISEIKKICDEIIEIVKEIRKGWEPVLPLPPEEVCKTPEKLAEESSAAYPRKRAASLVSLLNCISQKTGKALPPEGNVNQFYGSLYTYEHKNELCNYTRGKETCGTCSHVLYSCHYGGASGTDGALAVDFGNEKNGDEIIKAALICGAKNPRCEDISGSPVKCSENTAHHIHINSKDCDRN